MRHDQAYMIKIERWVRVFAWIYFVEFLLGLTHIPKIVKVFTTRFMVGPYGPIGNRTKAGNVAWYLFNMVVPIGFFFLLQGLAKMIRYLLALWEDMKRRRGLTVLTGHYMGL